MPNAKKMVTLQEMLGDELAAWLVEERRTNRLTLKSLREKLEESRVPLLARGVDAGYAFYAVEYALTQTGQEIPRGE